MFRLPVGDCEEINRLFTIMVT